MGLGYLHPTSLLSESHIPPHSFPFIFADSQLHCGCHTSLMPNTVPCCHGNNHFKKQYNKISNNESFSSLYQSPEGERRARNRTQPSRKEQWLPWSCHQTTRFPSPLSTVIYALPDNVRQHADFVSRECRSLSETMKLVLWLLEIIVIWSAITLFRMLVLKLPSSDPPRNLGQTGVK